MYHCNIITEAIFMGGLFIVNFAASVDVSLTFSSQNYIN